MMNDFVAGLLIGGIFGWLIGVLTRPCDGRHHQPAAVAPAPERQTVPPDDEFRCSDCQGCDGCRCWCHGRSEDD